MKWMRLYKMSLDLNFKETRYSDEREIKVVLGGSPR